MDPKDENAQLRAELAAEKTKLAAKKTKTAALEAALDAEKTARADDKKRSVALEQLRNDMVILNAFLKERLFIKKYCTRSCVQSALIFPIQQ